MTKEHIEKVIRSNRPGIAAHQLWREFETERLSILNGASSRGKSRDKSFGVEGGTRAVQRSHPPHHQFCGHQKSVNGGCHELRQNEDSGRRVTQQAATDGGNGNVSAQLKPRSQPCADATTAKPFIEETILATDHGHNL